MDRPFFYFNLGSTQDPRTALIGTTHFDKESGTYFNQSTFIKAIQIPDAVILLDELSRAHPEAWNILMTVLDDGQRYVRVDESPDAEVIKVAPGVSFLATANIGVEYTSTRVIDRAIQDRFLILEMDLLDKTQQGKLINYVCPNLNEQTVDILTSIYTQVYNEVLSGHGKVSTSISTRTILRAASLICDGFTIGEALEVCVFPYFAEDGGTDSERTFVRQIVQKFIPIESLDNDNMFDEGDTAKS
jgi:nitric oxide reductase NorQ protein